LKEGFGLEEITKETTLGEIIDKYHQVAPVIEKYFHGGCFECPGKKLETLEMAAMLHGYNVDDIIAELKELIKD
jgi:hybrid cluster-associated redox disulfide protein